MPHARPRPHATQHLRPAVGVWQIATGALLRHLPGMNVPVLLAVDILDGTSPISIGLVLTLGGLVAGGLLKWAKESSDTKSEVRTLRQDLNAETKAREELAADVKRAGEASQRRAEDNMHRFAQIEGQAGRVDERLVGMQGQLSDVKKGNDRITAQLEDLLAMERRSYGTRKGDRGEAA